MVHGGYHCTLYCIILFFESGPLGFVEEGSRSMVIPLVIGQRRVRRNFWCRTSRRDEQHSPRRDKLSFGLFCGITAFNEMASFIFRALWPKSFAVDGYADRMVGTRWIFMEVQMLVSLFTTFSVPISVFFFFVN